MKRMAAPSLDIFFLFSLGVLKCLSYNKQDIFVNHHAFPVESQGSQQWCPLKVLDPRNMKYIYQIQSL